MAFEFISRNAPCPCGSGKKFKKCCLEKSSGSYEGTGGWKKAKDLKAGDVIIGPNGKPATVISNVREEHPEAIHVFEPRSVYSDGASLLPPRPKPLPKMGRIYRVYVEYTFPEQFGTGKVWYCFPIGRPIVLEGGFVLPVEKLKVGNRFLMQRGVIATVTVFRSMSRSGMIRHRRSPTLGLDYKRVIGKVEHTGNVVMDVSFLGMTVTSTPDHGYFSVTRNRYVPAAYLQVGELLQTPEGQTAKVDAVSPPRYGLVKLYNIEVQDFHNYFVGGANGAVQVHNGVPVWVYRCQRRQPKRRFNLHV